MMKLGHPDQTGAELGKRDAFHVPAVLVTISNPTFSKHFHLKGGERVRFVDDSFTTVVLCNRDQMPHGIVDPFVDRVLVGEKFWVLLWPSMVKEKLTHHFDLNIDDVTTVPNEPQEPYDNDCRGC